MKKTLFTLLTLLSLWAGVAAQSRTTIKVNPLSLGVLTLNFQGEHAINERVSAQVGLFYGGLKLGGGIANVGSLRMAYKWMGITPEIRYFLHTPDAAPNGLYLAPFMRIQKVTADFDLTYHYIDGQGVDQTDQVTARLSTPSIGGGAVVGYSWIIGNHFVWDTFIGPSFYGGKTTLDAQLPTDAQYDLPKMRFGTSGFALRFGTSFGVAF